MPAMSSSTSSTTPTLTPTSRSRTLLFLSYRTPSSRNRTNPFLPDSNLFDEGDEHQRLIPVSAEQGHIALDVSLPPKWVDISDQVHDILAATQQKITVLERLHAKHVLPGFADRSAEEREIEGITSDITRDFRRCHSLIQSIPAASAAAAEQQHRHTFPPHSHAQSQHEKLAAQNAQRALAAEVQGLSATFRKKQRVYLDTLQGHAIKNQDLLVASGALTLKGSEGMSDVDEDMRFASQNQSTHQLQRQQDQEEDIDTTILTRDREITEIAKSIGALAELFKDLQTLVIDQGTLLDSVEYNIEQTSVYMQEAVTDLKVAEGYQRNTGRRKCIFLLLLIIFGLVVVLIFKPRRHAASAPPQTTTNSESRLDSTVKELLSPIPIDVTPLNPEAVGIGADAAPAAGRVHSARGKHQNSDLGLGSALGTKVNDDALFRVGLRFTRRDDSRLAFPTDTRDETETETGANEWSQKGTQSQTRVQSGRRGRSRGRRIRRRQDRDYG